MQVQILFFICCQHLLFPLTFVLACKDVGKPQSVKTDGGLFDPQMVMEIFVFPTHFPHNRLFPFQTREMVRNLVSSWGAAVLPTLLLCLLVAHQPGAAGSSSVGSREKQHLLPKTLLCLLAAGANQAEAGGGSGLLIGLANVRDSYKHQHQVFQN